MTYESTCPRCGAMLTSGGCLSCGYPNGSLRERTAADTVLAEKSKGDAPPDYVRIQALIEAFENLAYVRQRLADAEAERDEARRELAEAEEAIPLLHDLAVRLHNDITGDISSPIREARRVIIQGIDITNAVHRAINRAKVAQ